VEWEGAGDQRGNKGQLANGCDFAAIALFGGNKGQMEMKPNGKIRQEGHGTTTREKGIGRREEKISVPSPLIIIIIILLLYYYNNIIIIINNCLLRFYNHFLLKSYNHCPFNSL
jgi:hypothetical protein